MSQNPTLFVLNPSAYTQVYAPSAAAAIGGRVRVLAPPLTAQTVRADPTLLRDVELIFSGWGCPKMDAALLELMPNLKAVFYAAGAISGWATPRVWERGIVVTTANDANAIPVAEFTVAMAIYALKQGWQQARALRDPATAITPRPDVAGAYRSIIGLVGMGTIARLVVRLLAGYDVSVLTHDPYLPADEAAALGVTSVGLDELFARSDVVSLHAPDLPTTRGLIDGRLVRSMRPGTTLINTSRGRVVNEPELIDALRDRPDVQAVLDVTQKEPPPADSPLRTLANVALTPHIAGSQGRECQRMGQYMVDELDRYLTGRPLKHQVRPAETSHSVHQIAR